MAWETFRLILDFAPFCFEITILHRTYRPLGYNI